MIPRIVGGVALLIAVVAFLRGIHSQAIILGLAGIALLTAKKKALELRTQEYVESLKLGKDFLQALVIDVGFLLFFFLTMHIAAIFLGGAPEVSMQEIDRIKTFLVKFSAVLLILMAANIAAHALSRLAIWNTFVKKKFHWKRALGFGFIWATAWMLVFLLAGFAPAIVQIPVMLTVIILYAHLSTVPWLSLCAGKTISATISEVFLTGFGKIPKYLVPYSYILITYMVAGQAFSLFNIYIIPYYSTAQQVIGVVFMLAILAWARGYLTKMLWPILKSRR